MVLGDVGIHDPAEAVVDQRLLVEGHADAPDDAAHDLAVRRLRIEYATGGDRVDDARDADDANLLVHLHLGKDRRVGVAGVRVILRKLRGLLALDAIYAALPHCVDDRYGAGAVL